MKRENFNNEFLGEGVNAAFLDKKSRTWSLSGRDEGTVKFFFDEMSKRFPKEKLCHHNGEVTTWFWPCYEGAVMYEHFVSAYLLRERLRGISKKTNRNISKYLKTQEEIYKESDYKKYFEDVNDYIDSDDPCYLQIKICLMRKMGKPYIAVDCYLSDDNGRYVGIDFVEKNISFRLGWEKRVCEVLDKCKDINDQLNLC